MEMFFRMVDITTFLPMHSQSAITEHKILDYKQEMLPKNLYLNIIGELLYIPNP